MLDRFATEAACGNRLESCARMAVDVAFILKLAPLAIDQLRRYPRQPDPLSKRRWTDETFELSLTIPERSGLLAASLRV